MTKYLTPVLVLLMATTAHAQQADTDSDTLTVLARQLEELDQKVRIFERKAELQKEADAARATALPAITVASDGVTMRAGDGSFQLKMRGYVQQDARFYNADATGGTDAFLLRRVRPIFEMQSGKFGARLMPDFGGGTTVLQDAHIDVNFVPQAQLRAGKFKPPVGLERLASATALRFVERALPTALVPNRDLGVQLSGEFAGGALGYAIGAFNGVVDGGSADTDTNDSKEVAARVYTTKLLNGLTLGVAATRGRTFGSTIPSYRTPGQVDFFTFRALTTDGTRERLTGHGSFYRGRTGIMGEYVQASQHVRIGAASGVVEQNAWQLSAGFVLTGEANTAGGVRPRVTLDPAKGTWGALELVARVHALDIDDGAFPTFADPTRSATAAQAWGAGVNWYWNRNVKFVVNYDHTSFDGGAADGDRAAENLVFARLQFAY